MSAVIHVVPRLPPAVCGVGDYALLVGSAMEKLHSELHCGYIACGQELLESPHRPGERNATGLCNPSLMWRLVEELAGELNGE